MAWVLGHSRLGLLVLGCLAFFGVPAVASAATLYVSNAPGAVPAPPAPPGTGCATGQAGYAGIQDAIDAASSGDLIFVCPGTYTGPWTVTDKNLTFSGAGDGTDPALNTIIDGESVRDGFRIATASGTPVPLSAAFTGFRFIDNVAPNVGDAIGGSAIRPVGANVDLELNVIDSTFTGNSTPGGTADPGGAVFAANLVATGSTFTLNQADGDGGAIAIESVLEESAVPLTIEGSVFQSNTASRDGGALYVDLGEATPSLGDFGGFVVASDFVGNSSEDDGGAIYVSRGNLYVGDGSGPFSVGPESVTGCPEFSGNEASDDGGAIYQSGRALGLLICDAGGEGGEEILFADNVAGGDGGAIRWGPTQTSLDEFWGFLSYGASLTGNEAGGSGGAIRAGFIYEALATRFDQNLAESGDGGAISALVAELEGSEMTRNSAVNGGAISASGIGIGDGRVEGNRALGDGASGGDGGGLHAPAPSEEAFGPEASGFVQLEFVELDGNTATGDGGAAMVEGVSQVLASTITGNRAAGEGGGLATYKSTPSSGSFAVAAALATTFDSNQAGRGGAIYSEEAAFSGAGSGPSSTTHGDYREALGKEAGLPGIPNDLLSTMGLKRLRDRIDLEEEFEVRNGPGDDGSTFSNNSASESGSAISARAFASLVNSTVTGNRGPAAVEVTDPDAEALVVENVTVAGNDPQAGPVLSVPAAILASANSIVSEEGPACAFGSSESLGGNVVSTRTSGCDSLVGGPAPSLQTPISPVQIGLEPLADNGGYTETMALSGRSIALSTALAEACPPQDQRGVARDPLTCDPGAYEYTGPLDPILGVEKLGTGTGTVSTDPSGVDCGETCALRYPADGVVTLTATPTDGSTFTGWTGSGCSGTGTCQVTMSRARTVEATFTAGPGPGQGVRVRKFRQGTNRVPGDRKVRIARVSCLVGNCEIESAKVTFLARRKSFGGRVVVPSRSLEAGESVVISAFMPKKAFRRLGRTRTGVASLLVEVDSSNQTAVLRGVRIGLKRGAK